MKKFAVFIFFISFFLFSCGKQNVKKDAEIENTGSHKEELIIGSAVDINNLNLLKQADQINNICLKLTHQTLFYLDEENRRIPALATEAEWIDDNTIEIALVHNACFSDGTPVTAKDVKFTFDMALTNPVGSNLTGLISTDIVDDYTVRMNMKDYSNDYLMSLTYIPFGIQSKAAYDSAMEEPWLIGSGQYILDKWVAGEYSTFVKNEKYWGDNPGIAERITFKPILEASRRVEALQNGEIDVCIDPPVNELELLKKSPNIVVYEKVGTRLFYFGVNCAKKPFDNKKLRQAIACSIDRHSVMQAAVKGKGTPQTTILNRGLWGFYDGMHGFDYDVERAKKLLAEAGYASGFDTTLTIANSSPYMAIAQVIKDNLKAIGINAEIKMLEDAALKTTCKAGTQDMFLWRWNETIRPDCVYRDLFYTGSASNFHHYSDKVADMLVDRVLKDKGTAQRTSDSKELQTYLVNACPQVPLYIANLVIAYNKDLVMPFFRSGGDHEWFNAYVKQ